MNGFTDLDHALLTGVVLAHLRSKGITANVVLNDVEDNTPYLSLDLEGTGAVIVVLPPE